MIGNTVGGACKVQHGRPEERVEINDVLADEVNLFGVRTRQFLHEIESLLGAIGFEAGQVADRRIKPNVEVLAGCIRDFNAEIGGIARNVPVGKIAVEPFVIFGENFSLHAGFAVGAIAHRPVFEEGLCTRIRQAEEVVRGGLQNRYGTRDGAVGINQVGRRIHRAALFARVAVLIRRAALRAGALDEAVGEEHADFFVVELLNIGGVDETGILQTAIDVLREFGVFRTFGAVPVIKVDVEVVEILLATGRDLGDKFLRRNALFARRNHDRGTVSVVSAYKMHVVAAHSLVAHPDVGLDVFQNVAEMEGAVCIGQSGGHENIALGVAHCLSEKSVKKEGRERRESRCNPTFYCARRCAEKRGQKHSEETCVRLRHSLTHHPVG